MKRQIALISSWPYKMAPSITSSERIFAPASTIIIASSVPDTVRLSSEFSSSSSDGLITYSPLIYPTLTAPVGPWNGISEIESATEEPFIAKISGGFSLSQESTVAITCTSL